MEATANRSRVSSAHNITTVNFQKGGGSRREGINGTLVAAAAVRINIPGGIVFHVEETETFVTIDLTENREIYIPN